LRWRGLTSQWSSVTSCHLSNEQRLTSLHGYSVRQRESPTTGPLLLPVRWLGTGCVLAWPLFSLLSETVATFVANLFPCSSTPVLFLDRDVRSLFLRGAGSILSFSFFFFFFPQHSAPSFIRYLLSLDLPHPTFGLFAAQIAALPTVPSEIPDTATTKSWPTSWPTSWPNPVSASADPPHDRISSARY